MISLALEWGNADTILYRLFPTHSGRNGDDRVIGDRPLTIGREEGVLHVRNDDRSTGIVEAGTSPTTFQKPE